MNYPLEGYTALECGIFHAGPGATAILGDLGADVIKIEPPKGGDPIRRQHSFGGANFSYKGSNIFCEGANRNKKSITIDLHKDKGREIVYRLVEKADIFLTNFRQDAVVRMRRTWLIVNVTSALARTASTSPSRVGVTVANGLFNCMSHLVSN